MFLLVAYPNVAAAAKRIEGVAHRTPVLTSTTADELTGAQTFFKPENLQRMGAFVASYVAASSRFTGRPPELVLPVAT